MVFMRFVPGLSRRASLVIVVALLSIAAVDQASADESLAILPQSFTLTGPEARQLLLVEDVRNQQFTGQVTDAVTLTSSKPQVVAIQDGVAVPIGDGQATITATVGRRTATAEVTVAAFAAPFQWSFRNHVESVLAKAGCNSGACHGAASGKNGFRLSLRGYDPDGDYRILTRQARGRRIVPSDPGRSLMLTKPTGLLPHGGGMRFDVGSRDFQVLSQWIASGAPAPAEADPRIERLEILPDHSILKPGDSQQLLVRAYFSDGHSEDVTRWAKYTSANETVAQVDDHGGVKVMGHGEGAVTAWYLSRVVAATVTVPYPHAVPADVFTQAPRTNFIDELVLAKLRDLNLPPSPPAGDAEFLRRAYIDTIGVLPAADETRQFLADSAPDKRNQLIERLLQRPEFVDYWAYKWSDLLLVNGERLKPAAMWSYYHWIRNHVAANTPWDDLARQLLTARGSTMENGAANFFVLHEEPLELAETTSMAFLGMSINCARCHNHPLEKWTNRQYYGMANLFARVRTKDVDANGNKIIFSATDGELIQPLTGNPVQPTPLDGTPVSFDATDDRRIHLAEWLVSPENPYFSRAITNRIWANFFAVGLVENVDDLRLTNPASNGELLAAAAGYLVEHDFDLKALMSAILQSQTYQRSSAPLPENVGDKQFYARYYPRRMMAEVLLDAVSQVTAAPTEFAGYATGWRATQLPDSNVNSYFLKSFGRPERVTTCECERTDEASMVQVLHVWNGDTINKKLEAKGNRVEQLLAAGMSNEQIIDEAYLGALSRYPMESERSKLLAAFGEAQGSERRLLVEDLYWSILSSKEFLFSH